MAHLLRTFLGLDIQSIETGLTLKCIENLIVTLIEIMQGDKERDATNMGQLIEKREQVVHTCIRMVDLICEYSLA